MSRSPHRITVFASLLLTCAPVAFAQVPAADADRDSLAALGVQYGTAEALFAHFKEQANGGAPLAWETLPDWKGVYSVAFTAGGLAYDYLQESDDAMPTAKLRPEFYAKVLERVTLRNQGIEYDPLGSCEPPGAPRGVSEPFLREYAVTPEQTWLMNEVGPEIRRIYTDGREHLPEVDRFPTFDGDSIGFWSNGALVIHTNQLREGMYQRGQPDYTDQIELVEIMQKLDERTMVAHIWAFDPVVLEEPWYTKKTYIRLTDPDKVLRIHFWYCFDNQNNDVEEQDDGSTTFTDFSFD